MKNRIADLNNHLFSSLERLNDEDLKPEDIPAEAERAKAVASVAEKVLATGRLALEAAQFAHEASGAPAGELPEMLRDPARGDAAVHRLPDRRGRRA